MTAAFAVVDAGNESWRFKPRLIFQSGVPKVAPPSKNAPAAFLRARFFDAKPQIRRHPTVSRSLATAPWRARSLAAVDANGG